MTTAFTELRAAEIPVRTSCTLTGISRATHYRHRRGTGRQHGPWLPRRPPPAALAAVERQQVLDLLDSPAYREPGDPADLGA